MALARWDPASEIVSLRQALARLRDERVVVPGGGAGGAWGGAGGVALDVSETDAALVVTAALPGVRPEDVNITVQGNVLTIQGELREEGTDGGRGGRYYLRERPVGRLVRQVRLPAAVNLDTSAASLADGILTITLPKTEAARPTPIPVRGGHPQTVRDEPLLQTAAGGSQASAAPGDQPQAVGAGQPGTPAPPAHGEALAVGARVVTADGAELGTVKEVRGPAFKVDAPLQPDYWLGTACIATTGAGEVRLTITRAQLGEAKVTGPDEAAGRSPA